MSLHSCLSAFALSVCLVAVPCLPGSARSGAPASAEASSPSLPATVTVPGPLRSFLRMAAISQKVSPEEVLPLLARNVEVEGYSGWGKSRRPTEYLILVERYLQQSRELLALAGPKGVIRVDNCSEAQPLLTILGYRLPEGCGPHAYVQSADPGRAFLTTDSGFPLADLEEALQVGRPFVYPYSASRVPMLLSPSDWQISNKDGDHDVVDALLGDPMLARLYWALARTDANTRVFLRRSPGLQKLMPLATVLEFYGSDICIRSGRVLVPGGTPAESAWKNLVGASPHSPGEFVSRLLAKDDGWLAAYFDALSRASRTRQTYFTNPHRLRRFYEALRSTQSHSGAAGSVYRPDAALLLLVTRLQLEPTGQPHVPGDLETWAKIFSQRSHSKIVRAWARRARHWDDPDQLLEAMFALSRAQSENGPLRVYLTLDEMDRGRLADQRLSPETVRLLAKEFPRFSDQYSIFSEFRVLNDASITDFLRVAAALDRISNRTLRSDALGIFQAEIGLWQILARQGQIPRGNCNASWQQVINPFAGDLPAPRLYDVARSSIEQLFRATAATAQPSEDSIIGLLAGPEQTSADGQQVRQEMANQIRSVLDSQRLVSLDTLFALGDNLNQLAQGKAKADTIIRLSGELREFQMPKPLFSKGERIEWTRGPYGNSHTDLESATNLARIVKTARSHEELAAARGKLVPFLRDSLVGLNYAYYAPPGARMLYNNPLLVRSHDFSGEMLHPISGEEAWKTPTIVGRGWTAGGGAHLAGSLADLPYVLAEVEQNFIVPENVQALIWEDLVPSFVTSAVLPRWWRVTRNELHAVALYQRFGEDLLTAAGENEQLLQAAMEILSERTLPRTLGQVEQALRAGHRDEALFLLAPGQIFYLGVEFQRRFPDQATIWGKSGQDLAGLAQRDPESVDWERLSEDFGVPHPALAQTYAREILPLKPFPSVMGYASQLEAESWDSNNLYWARLADELGYEPVALNHLVPELTHRMVEKIFATYMEDWPALLRALRETGEEFRLGKIPTLPKASAASEL